MEILAYVIIVLGVGLLIFGGVYLKRKYEITLGELEFAQLIIKVANEISKQVDFKYTAGINKIAENTILAIDLVIEIDGIEGIEDKIDVIVENTKQICINEGIDIEDGTAELIEKLVKETFKILKKEV